MVGDLEHASHDHALHSPPTDGAIPSTLTPALRDQFGELVDLQVGGRELPQPRQDDLHATPSNCARKRTSLSTSMRMSGIAYRRSAIRSMPTPNAKPV